MNRRNTAPSGPRQQRGFALFLGMIFLLMITLVAVTAMRGTSLELNMANNTANQEHAFEGAESARAALIRAIRDHAACEFKWPSNAVYVGGGSACVSGCVIGRDGNTVNYPWEPSLQLVPPGASLEGPVAGEMIDNPSTFVDRFELQFADTGRARVKVGRVPPIADEGGGLGMVDGYNKPEGAAGSTTLYFDIVSTGSLANSRGSVAGHYRLLTREADSGCATNGTFTF